VVDVCPRGALQAPENQAWKAAASAAMDRYASGADEAFGELYDLLEPRLSAFLLRRVRCPARTEDLVQQTFLQMHCARRHFVAGASVATWAFAIARRLLIDWLRKGGREHALGGAEADERESDAPGTRTEDAAIARRLARRLDEELARVSDLDRTAFELVRYDGLSMAEAAEVLGTTENAVKLRSHRACEAIRASLGDEVREELGWLT
jgi:RNA polymerase sigma-70 factor (ECF subfamily)